MIDQMVLGDTLQKINASLNKRFEKDADLYISKQDEFEIKKLLCSNKYQAIINMSVGKDIKPEIILKVIVRNAGLITVPRIGKFWKELKPIWDNVRYESVAYMMEDVMNNMVYVNKDLKHLLFKYYIKGISYQERSGYWDADKYTLDTRERKDLFLALIQGTRDDEPDFDEKWKFIVEAIDDYKYLLKDSDLLVDYKKALSESESKAFFKQICREMNASSVKDDMYDNMIISTYVTYGDDAFNDAVKNLKEGHRNYKLYTKAIVELLCRKEEISIIKARFDAFFKLYQQPALERHIRTELDRKVWKAAKKRNPELYQERKPQIDTYITEEDNTQYNTFTEVFNAILERKKAKDIAYVWVNMKSEAFKKSLADAFSYDGRGYDKEMKEVFEWLFKHNQRRNSSHYKKICENVADALVQMGEINTPFAKIADDLLLVNILEHNVEGKSIKDYLTTYHFEEFKSQYSE